VRWCLRCVLYCLQEQLALKRAEAERERAALEAKLTAAAGGERLSRFDQPGGVILNPGMPLPGPPAVAGSSKRLNRWDRDKVDLSAAAADAAAAAGEDGKDSKEGRDKERGRDKRDRSRSRSRSREREKGKLRRGSSRSRSRERGGGSSRRERRSSRSRSRSRSRERLRRGDRCAAKADFCCLLSFWICKRCC
jgi:hypothetical protein